MFRRLAFVGPSSSAFPIASFHLFGMGFGTLKKGIECTVILFHVAEG